MYLKRKIEVPAAGVKTKLTVSGFAVTIEAAPTFGSPEHVPNLTFDTASEQLQPIYPKSVYNAAPECSPDSEFAAIWIHGTTESEGSEIYLLINDEWQEQRIEPSDDRVLVGTTSELSVDNTAVVTIPTGSLQHPDTGKAASAILLTFEGNIRLAYNVDPVTAGGIGHMFRDTETLYIEGFHFIEALRMIADDATASIVNYTIEY